MKKITACTLDCADGCSFVAEVVNGKLRIAPNPDHPYVDGYICNKSSTYAYRFLRHKERITRPMLRGADDSFAPISWDEALDLCAERIQALRAEPEAILHLRGYGMGGVLAGASNYLFGQLGTAFTSGASLCLMAGRTANQLDFGIDMQPPVADLPLAARIVNWGRDAKRSAKHKHRMMQKARETGTKILTISPGGDDATEYADEHVLIRPGTDRYLALALIKLSYEMGRIEPATLERTANWPAFKKIVTNETRDFSYQALCDACGVSLETMERLYAWYDPAEPVATMVAIGLQKHLYGGETVRYLNALALLSGHVGRKGAGVYYTGPNRQMDTSFLAPPKPQKTLPIATIGQAMEEAEPKIQMAWVNGFNVANQAPDAERVERALRACPFTVVVDSLWTDTALCADLVLPPALMFEREDVVSANDHNHINYAGKVVDAPGECKSDYEIMALLGQRLSPPVTLPDNPDEWLAKAIDVPHVQGSLQELKEKGYLTAHFPEIPYENLVFEHPDGLYRFPEAFHPEPALDPAYPLHLITPANGSRLHSQVTAREMEGLPILYAAPENPLLQVLDQDKPVYVASPKGRVQVMLLLDETLHPDTVLARRGGWRVHGHGLNGIIEAHVADLAGQAAFFSQRVRLEN